MAGLYYCKRITNALSPYQALPEDSVIECDCTSGAITITLPYTGESNGMQFEIRKVDSGANTVTVNAKSTDTFMPGSGTSVTLANQGDFIQLISTGASINSLIGNNVWLIEQSYAVSTGGFAWIEPNQIGVATAANATLTRNAQGDWAWNQAGSKLEIYLVPLSAIAPFVSLTNKGAEITSFNVSESIATAANASETYTLLTTIYANNTANAVSSVATSGTAPTTFSGTALPVLTNIPVASPIFFNTTNVGMMLEISVQTSGGSYRLNGVGVNYSVGPSPLGTV